MTSRPRLAPCSFAALLATASLSGAAGAAATTALSSAELETIAAQVTAAETAFAASMADRRIEKFADFVAEDAVFRGSVLRVGRANVVDAWRAFFAKPQAPFSWSPDAVTVAADGRSAISTGPVRTPDGRVVSRFTSLWRHDADGHWRVFADQGVDACERPPAPEAGAPLAVPAAAQRVVLRDPKPQ